MDTEKGGTVNSASMSGALPPSAKGSSTACSGATSPKAVTPQSTTVLRSRHPSGGSGGQNLTKANPALGGWPRVAAEMEKRPIFQAFERFRRLNIKMLLYYQAELAMLQERLEMEEKSDARSTFDENRRFRTDASKMIPGIGPPDQVTSVQWDLVTKIRDVLKEYNAALLQFTQVSSLPEPSYENIQSFRRWLKANETYGVGCIEGAGSEAWGSLAPTDNTRGVRRRIRLIWDLMKSVVPPCDCDEEGAHKESDRRPRTVENLVSTLPRDEADALSTWLLERGAPLWYEFWCEEPKYDQSLPLNERYLLAFEQSRKFYSAKLILQFTMLLATILACALPTAGVGILAIVHPLAARIILIGVFSMLLSASLLLVTQCGRVEVFMATAAFAAVLVVFIQDSSHN